MEINYDDVLTQDSLFLLELCPTPSFLANSQEQHFAQKWLDHLCTYEVEDLDDRRIRNIYISHLCAALIQQQLYGPFTKEPPKGKLEKIDFHAAAASCPNASILQPLQQPNAHSTLQYPALIQQQFYEPFSNEPPKDKLEKIDYHATAASCPNASILQPLQQPNAHSTLQYPAEENVCQTNVCSPQQSASYTIVNATKTINSTGVETQGHITVGSTNLSFNVTSGSPPETSTACKCPPKPCTCNIQPCQCNRSSAGSDLKAPNDDEEEVICNYLMQQLNLTPDFLNEFDATLTSFMDLCKVASLEGKTHMQKHYESKSELSLEPPKYYFLPKKSSSPVQDNNLENSSQQELMPRTTTRVTSATEYEEMREDINELLEAISAELRGDSEPGSNDYLDRELARYKNFLMNQNHLSDHFCSLTSEHKIRNCLLLSLQNSLVKLLNDSGM
ncbi:uncharacterized protein ACRADG_002849 [Cochliomyia hominivorax]